MSPISKYELSVFRKRKNKLNFYYNEAIRDRGEKRKKLENILFNLLQGKEKEDVKLALIWLSIEIVAINSEYNFKSKRIEKIKIEHIKTFRAPTTPKKKVERRALRKKRAAYLKNIPKKYKNFEIKAFLEGLSEKEKRLTKPYDSNFISEFREKYKKLDAIGKEVNDDNYEQVIKLFTSVTKYLYIYSSLFPGDKINKYMSFDFITQYKSLKDRIDKFQNTYICESKEK